MYDVNQKVTVKWHASNMTRLKSLGYVFTHIGDPVIIRARELPVSSQVKVIATCDYCGDTYTSPYTVVYTAMQKHGKNACKYCAAKKSRTLDARKRSATHYEKIKEMCERRGYKLLTDRNTILKATSLIEYLCPEHGKQTATVDNLEQGHGCYHCGRDMVGVKLRKSQQQIMEEIKRHGDTILNPNEYTDAHCNNLRFICSCGQEFTTSYANYIDHNVRTCRTCSIKTSVGERKIEEVLTNLNIEYVREKRFNDCKDKKPLPFDFYLPCHNAIIEFDGIHHFKDTPLTTLEDVVKHDSIKNNYCDSNHIPILRIPYWKQNDIEVLIKDFLNR